MKYGYLEVATQKTEDELLESDNLLNDDDLREAWVLNIQNIGLINSTVDLINSTVVLWIKTFKDLINPTLD